MDYFAKGPHLPNTRITGNVGYINEISINNVKDIHKIRDLQYYLKGQNIL